MASTGKKKYILFLAILFNINFAHAQQSFVLPINNGQNIATSTATVSLSTIDLIVEANTYKPYFYKGRSEPIVGSSVKITAIPETNIQASRFNWRIGSQNITTSAPFVITNLPATNREVLISVTVSTASGQNIGTASEYIKTSSPKILFYENNELRGLNQNSIGKNLILIGNETSVRAEPFFFGTQSLLSNTLGSWQSQGVNIVLNPNDWREVSLIRSDSFNKETTEVILNVRSQQNLSEITKGIFNLNL